MGKQNESQESYYVLLQLKPALHPGHALGEEAEYRLLNIVDSNERLKEAVSIALEKHGLRDIIILTGHEVRITPREPEFME